MNITQQTPDVPTVSRLQHVAGLVCALLFVLAPIHAASHPVQIEPHETFLSQPVTETVAQMEARDRLQIQSPDAPLRIADTPRPDLPDLRLASVDLTGPPASAGDGPIKIGPAAEAPQILSTSFQAISLIDQLNDFGTGSIPPDTMGAVGPHHFVEVINSSVAIYTKAGVRLSHVSLDSFFTAVIGGTTYPRGGSFDPRVIYDRRSGRWMAVALERGSPSGSDNDVILAVSETDDPTGPWNKYLIPVGEASRFSDYDTLGTDDNGVYVAVAMFPTSSGSVFAKIAAVPKAQVLVAGTAIVSLFTSITDMYSTPQPAHNLDPVAAGDRAWFVASSDTVFGNVNYRRLTWSGATPTLDATSSVLTTPAYGNPPHAPASGSTTAINVGDDRIQMATIRANSLWTCRHVGTDTAGGAGSTRTGCEWLQLNVTTATPTLTQSGRVFDSAASNPRYYFYPSIMVNGQGHAVMGFSGVKSTEFVGAYFTGRLNGDTGHRGPDQGRRSCLPAA